MSRNDPDTVKALRKHENTGRPIGDNRFIEKVKKSQAAD